MPGKTTGIGADLHAYVVGHCSARDAVMDELVAETATLGGISMMQVAEEQAALLTLLARMLAARNAVEVGTFTGLSALAIARGLVPGGRLLCCDVSEEWTALARRAWQRAGTLKGGGVVATIMSNLGLERFVAGLGLKLERTQVGDRYVVEHMRKRGINLGGEQSGQIIHGDVSTTGDGLIAALQVMAVMVRDGLRASEVARVFTPLPQVKRNIVVESADPLGCVGVRDAISSGEAELGSRGRLVVRRSGTEKVVRVMAEGDDEVLVGRVADSIARALREAAARLPQ